MYSYTVTNINRVHSIDPNEPQLRVRCKCERDLIQEQIYTCLSCSNYCCHYCTSPEILCFQCRNCNATTESSKANKCKMCFACPYCSNVLTITKTPDKKSMMWCQFCYWTSKEIDMIADKNEDLIEALNKNSSNLKGNEQKIYNATQGLFKEITTIVEYENQNFKPNSKKSLKKNQQQSLMDTKNQMEKTCQNLIKRLSLDDLSQQFDGEVKLPQNLVLLAKKTRRCPTCKKPLTTTYKSNKSGEQKTQLMFKDIKMLQCQIKPVKNKKAKIKCLKELTLNKNEVCKEGEIKEVQVNKLFKVKVNVVNKTRQTSTEIEYDFIVLTPEKQI